MMQYDDLYQFEGDATICISYSNDHVDYLVGGAFIWYTFLSIYNDIYIESAELRVNERVRE